MDIFWLSRKQNCHVYSSAISKWWQNDRDAHTWIQPLQVGTCFNRAIINKKNKWDCAQVLHFLTLFGCPLKPFLQKATTEFKKKKSIMYVIWWGSIIWQIKGKHTAIIVTYSTNMKLAIALALSIAPTMHTRFVAGAHLLVMNQNSI